MGEFGLVKALTARFAQSDDVVVGPGDDAAVLKVAGDVVASVDLLVQNRHFRLDWSSAADIGHKAAAENLSDINAMGGRATALLVGLGAPADLDVDWAMEFADGLAAEAAKVGASIIGGDLTQADQMLISVTALGVCEHGVVRRAGAQPGDVVALAGRQGWAGAGFHVLGRGFRSPRVVVDAHRRPDPPYEAGPQAARARRHLDDRCKRRIPPRPRSHRRREWCADRRTQQEPRCARAACRQSAPPWVWIR